MSSDTWDPLVSVYAIADALILIPIHRTTDGFGLAGPPCARVSVEIDDTPLGAMLRVVFSTIRRNDPTPARNEYAARTPLVLGPVGFRSWGALERHARQCVVRQLGGGTLRFEPSRHGGTRGPQRGFQAMPEAEFELPAADDRSIGAALRRALAAATPNPELASA